MFGEISLLAWMGGAIVFAIGGGAGFFIARQIKDKRTLELEQQLLATQNKLSDYQGEVNRHFLKSSLLFNKLTDNYREVYEHLATGAQKLCNEKPITPALDLPDTKILSAAVSATAGAEAITEEIPETTDAVPEFAEAKHHDAEPAVKVATDELTEHLGAESTVDHQAMFENQAEAEATEKADADKNSTVTTQEAVSLTEAQLNNLSENMGTAAEENDTPSISEAELKTLEANAKTQKEEDDIHLGAESTPGVEMEHHKTHPAIH